MKRTTVNCESWQCHTILTKAKVTKSILSLRDDLWVNPKNVKVENVLSRIRNPTAIVRFTESLKENAKCWQLGRREVGKYTSHMFSVNINPTECQKLKARKGDAAYFEISAESVLIWWLPSWKSCQCIRLHPMDSSSDSESEPLDLLLSKPQWKRSTETYQWLILWGVLLCSCQRAKPLIPALTRRPCHAYLCLSGQMAGEHIEAERVNSNGWNTFGTE